MLDPVTGVLIGSVGSALIGGLGSIFGQSSANETNVQLAKENREWQTLENQRNRDWQENQNILSRNWQEKMWNLQNQYNTPSAMMQRYKEAGINPYLVSQDSGLGAAGSAGSPSVGSPSMVGAPNMPNIQPVDYGAPFSRAIDIALRSKAVDADSANQFASSLKSIVSAAQEVRANFGDDAGKEFLDKYLSQITPDMSQNDYKRTIMREFALKDLEIDYNSVRNWLQSRFDYQKSELALHKLQQEVVKINAEIDNIDMNTEKGLNEIDELVTRSAKNIAESAHLNADTSTINALRDFVVSSARSQAKLDYYEQQEGEAEFENRSLFRDWLKTVDARVRRKRSEQVGSTKFNSRSARWNKYVQSVKGTNNDIK